MRPSTFFGLTLALLGALALPAITAHAAVSTDSLVGYPSPLGSAALRQSFAVVRSWIIPTAEAAVSTDSLVGYWKFDEGTGTLAADSSGHSNNGTLTNGPTWSASPTNNISFTNPYALSFDGTDDYVSVSNNTVLQLATNMTLSAWVKSSNTDSSSDLVLSSWDTANYWFGKLDATTFAFYVDSIQNVTTPLSSLHNGNWHLVTGVASAAAGKLYLYVDGVAVNNASYDGTSVVGANTVYIGAQSATNRYNGSLDDVRIYSRALSAAEIAALAAGNHTTAVWDGSSSTDWETSANWDINAVPDPFTHVIVRDTSNDPKLAASVSGASLTIEASSSLDLSGYNFELNDGGALKGGGTLKLKGNEVLSNLGNLATTSTGTVLYYGTGSFTGLAAGDNYNNLTINDGLVGYWTFDEGTGTLAADSSGHGNNGTLTGGPTWSSDPTNSITFTNPYALSFDGTDDYVILPDPTSWLNFGTTNFAVSTWFNTDVPSTNASIIEWGTYNVGGFLLRTNEPTSSSPITVYLGNNTTGTDEKHPI